MIKDQSTITISFKPEERVYLKKFKEIYSVPTAVLKDFVINTVKNTNEEDTSPKPQINGTTINNDCNTLNSGTSLFNF